jgi:D-alanyl-lipoteichoic acid acyltransferase DltB (MBOAT superfamily)
LGGSRCGKWKVARNTLIIFLVSGFWHGANWTYVCWGAFHALLFLPLLISGKNRKYTDTVARGKVLPSLKEAGQMLMTFLLVVIGWVIFRAESIHQAWDYLSRIVVDFHPNLLMCNKEALLSIVILLVVEWLQREKQFGFQLEAKGIFRYRAVRWGMYYALFLFTFFLAGRQEEFIYFQF